MRVRRVCANGTMFETVDSKSKSKPLTVAVPKGRRVVDCLFCMMQGEVVNDEFVPVEDDRGSVVDGDKGAVVEEGKSGAIVVEDAMVEDTMVEDTMVEDAMVEDATVEDGVVEVEGADAGIIVSDDGGPNISHIFVAVALASSSDVKPPSV
jgi:hypothetical protein